MHLQHYFSKLNLKGPWSMGICHLETKWHPYVPVFLILNMPWKVIVSDVTFYISCMKRSMFISVTMFPMSKRWDQKLKIFTICWFLYAIAFNTVTYQVIFAIISDVMLYVRVRMGRQLCTTGRLRCLCYLRGTKTWHSRVERWPAQRQTTSKWQREMNVPTMSTKTLSKML